MTLPYLFPTPLAQPHSLKSIYIQDYAGISNAAPPNLPYSLVYGEEYILESLLSLKFRVCARTLPHTLITTPK